MTTTQRGHGGGAHPAPLSSVVIAVLWATQTFAIFYDSAVLQMLSAWLFSAYLVAGLVRGSRETRFVWLIAAIVGSLTLTRLTGERIYEAVVFAMLFTAWLPVLQAARIVARTASGVIESRRRIAELPDGRREPGFLFGAFGFGGFLNTGTYALLSTLTPSDATPTTRRRYAEACLRGVNLTIPWSPFFLAMAFVQSYLPAVPLWQVILTGLPISITGLAISLWLHGAVGERGARGTLLGRGGLLAACLHCLAPLVPILVVCGGGVVLVAAATGLGTLATVIVTLPVVIAAQLAVTGTDPRPLAGELTRKLPDLQGEITLISAGMILGVLLRDEPNLSAYVAPLLGGSVPLWLTPGLVTLAMILLGIANIHPIITGAAILGAIVPAASHASEIALFHAVLLGWSMSTIVSLSALSLIIAASMFQVRALSLVLAGNLRFILLFVPVVSFYLGWMA
ncbi:MAG: hypothetical protein GC150_15080 [Rhizobiales bacterium]|nr:hypothetical protein [Hyphomicrobiales bacterium]